MILSDGSIRAMKGKGVIAPWFDECVQPASYDVHLSPYFIRKGEEETHYDTFTLPPGELVLAATQERVRIPKDLVVHVEGRSSWGRLGLLTHITAGYVDPGFKGRITLELYNVGAQALTLPTGPEAEAIAQLVFMQLDKPAEKPYGRSRKNQYQGALGPRPSKFERKDD